MLMSNRSQHQRPSPGSILAKKFSLKVFLNGLIVVLVVVTGYFSYAFMMKSSRASSDAAAGTTKVRVIQLDVLNGCGAKGAGIKCTSYLRSNGFDVVEMKNYKTFTVPRTLVVDRVGDLVSARRVAASLGVSDQNVIQQINHDYFVDVSVIIGADYASLRALK
jgi:hypothetical protein